MQGMTLPEFRAALRTDLKDTGSLWSDAELDRSVKRAVEDLSRHLPKESIYEQTTDFDVEDESITTPDTAGPDAIVDAQTLNDVSAGDTLTITDKTPDVPRRLTVTLTDADNSVTELTIIVKGYDQNNHYIEERWTLPQLVAGDAVQGHRYFKYVEEVEVDNVAGTAAAGDVIDVGTGNAYDSYIFLANKPIRPKSETVTNAAGTTTYTRDTDYTMDYRNGAIKFINGGDMAAGTAYLIDYTKSRLGVDISSLIPIANRIIRVEYPVDLVPQQFVSFSIYGDFMYIVSKRAGQSQEEMTTSGDDHLAIYYEENHSPPGEMSEGSYPAILDQLVAIGAAGYALLIEAQQFEQQAATDLSALRTELGLTTAIHTLADTALDKVVTYLENNSDEDAKFWLTKITTDIAGLRTAILTAVDAANTYLDDVDTTDLGQATVGAEGLLETGDDKIDAVNTGSRVAELYADYARARTDIGNTRLAAAQGYLQEAGIRLNNLLSYIQQASGWSDIATGFMNEGRARLEEISQHLQEAGQWAETVNGDLVLSDRFRAEGLARLNEYEAKLRNKSEYRKRTSSVSTKQPA